MIFSDPGSLVRLLISLWKSIIWDKSITTALPCNPRLLPGHQEKSPVSSDNAKELPRDRRGGGGGDGCWISPFTYVLMPLRLKTPS